MASLLFRKDLEKYATSEGGATIDVEEEQKLTSPLPLPPTYKHLVTLIDNIFSCSIVLAPNILGPLW
jgi:hypothetical protein